MPVAETFTFTDEEGRSLSTVAELDSLVTLVDCENFLRDYETFDDLVDRKLGVSDDDHRNIVDLLIDQIEFATVIVLNKSDRIEAEAMEELKRFVHHLNPYAQILESQYGQVDLKSVLGTGTYNDEWAEGHPNWLAVPRGSEQSEVDEYGIESFIFEARRPFHPERFALALSFDDGILAGVMRSKGYCWIATHHSEAFRWSQAGVSIKMDQDGPWMCTVDDTEWPEDEASREWIMSTMEEPWGDRRQELVFIGSEMDEVVLRSRLEDCLLTDEEMLLPPEQWALWECPLPIPSMEEIYSEQNEGNE